MAWTLVVLAFVLLWVFGGERARQAMALVAAVVVLGWLLVNMEKVQSGVETVERVVSVGKLLGMGW